MYVLKLRIYLVLFKVDTATVDFVALMGPEFWTDRAYSPDFVVGQQLPKAQVQTPKLCNPTLVSTRKIVIKNFTTIRTESQS